MAIYGKFIFQQEEVVQARKNNRGSGGGEGISTVDASITWAKTTPTTDPQDSVNGESGRPGVSDIGCATTTLNDLSFKESGAGDSKTWTETGYVMVVSPVVVMVAVAALYPLSPREKWRGGSGEWILTLSILNVATFMSTPPRSNIATTEVLRLPNAVAFVPIYTSRTVPTRILVLLFAP